MRVSCLLVIALMATKQFTRVLTLTLVLVSTWCYQPPDVAPQLRRAKAGTFPGTNALTPGFSTTGVNKIKAFSEFTAKMFLNSWQTLWQKQRRVFNTDVQSLRKELLSQKTEADN